MATPCAVKLDLDALELDAETRRIPQSRSIGLLLPVRRGQYASSSRCPRTQSITADATARWAAATLLLLPVDHVATRLLLKALEAAGLRE